ncbi:MAG: hypothetical protein PV358_12175 [Acidimicrobiales bacterium]|nr:hypothetical protein [Acidimicrobiales bacterium]
MLNLSNVQTLLVSILGLVVICAGISITGRARRADLSESARTAGNTTLGVIVAAMGAGITLTMAFGGRVLTWLGIN